MSVAIPRIGVDYVYQVNQNVLQPVTNNEEAF